MGKACQCSLLPTTVLWNQLPDLQAATGTKQGEGSRHAPHGIDSCVEDGELMLADIASLAVAAADIAASLKCAIGASCHESSGGGTDGVSPRSCSS